MNYPKVTVATIMYGDRWKFLSQVVEAVINDPHVIQMIIVDNGATHKGQIQENVKQYGDKIVVIELEKNAGSAGGFSAALERARTTDCDYVFLLDDDSVPQENAIEAFANILKLFPGETPVLSGNRYNVLDNKEFFYRPTLSNDSPRGTFFEVFSIHKIFYFISLLFMRMIHKPRRGPFVPIIPTEAFIYGGAFIPITAVREAPLPDKSLFLYGDDLAYSWNIKKLGYKSYLCAVPTLHDVDMTFGSNSSHIFGQFDKQTSPFKVYYRMRNMVYLSRQHTYQGKISLFLNIIIWLLGLYVLGFSRYGFTSLYWKRVILLAKAVYAGYFRYSKLAKATEASFGL